MSEDFQKSAALVKALNLDPQTQLHLYGLYKQAIQGDNLSAAPTDPVALAKHNSWLQHSGKSSEQAQEEYLSLVASFTGDGWKMGVSRPVIEDEEPELLTDAEKNIKDLCSSVRESQVDFQLLHSTGINAQDKNGLTPLHHAVDEELEEMVAKLIEMGVDVNVQDSEGMTPAHYAAELDNKKIFEMLLRTGRLDLNLKDSDGNSVLDVVRENCAGLIKD